MRPQKITFGEMRSGGGPTGILNYCADYRCSHSVEMPADSGAMTSGFPILSPASSARPAASAARMSGRIGKAWSRNSQPWRL
jgi:hypothetical protein